MYEQQSGREAAACTPKNPKELAAFPLLCSSPAAVYDITAIMQLDLQGRFVSVMRYVTFGESV